MPEHEPRARTGLLLVLGKSRLDADDLDGARRAFRDAERLAEPYGLTIVQVIARCHLAEIDRRRGDGDEASSGARAALDYAAANGLAEHGECAVGHLVLANVHIDAGQLDEAAIEVERGAERWRQRSRTSRENGRRRRPRRVSLTPAHARSQRNSASS